MTPAPSTLWLTGLSAAGKTTLAHALAEALTAAGAACQVLDGDVVRQALSRDLGFSRADRSQNIQRVADRCRQLNDAGSWAIAAVISPYRADREQARRTVGEPRFFEIHLATPLTVCERRDPKGLYRRARAGEIAHFTGISDAYEVPQHPDLRFDTATRSVAECVDATMALLAAVSGNVMTLSSESVSNAGSI
ncbi:adenylyl-sulfate kinase [Ralstonia solanacearum]|nr:adenylyl-sulfate kinase [Ralstonia solanacearum]QVX39785.1 adenylyl-sulfate kinase [Ralstonia solanacearum]